MERVAILFNPAAGRGKSRKQRARIEKIFTRHHIPYELILSESESHLRQLTHQHGQAEKILVLVGGDTTFNIVVSELLGVEDQSSGLPKIGMIGTGSANDIVRSLALERVDHLCQAIQEDHVKGMDVGVLQAPDSRYHFLGTLSAGIGTTVNRYIESFYRKHPLITRLNPIRQTSLAIAGVRQAFKYRQVPCKIWCQYGQERREIEFSLLVFLNIPFYANGVQLARHVSPFDGVLNCFPLLTRSVGGTIRYWSMISRGRLQKSHLINSSQFKIISEIPLDWQADGEVIPNLTEFSLSIHPRAIPVFIGKY